MSSEWKLNPKTTALVLIDLQNAILGYETKHYAASEVVERSRAMAGAFRAKGAPGGLRARSAQRVPLLAHR